MGIETEIAWTDSTFNAWWGCQRVSPGCNHCYAEAWAKRTGRRLWGPESAGVGRRTFGDAHWAEPRKWNAAAAKSGKPHRVFCSSMADVFEDRRDLDAQRERLWALIEETPALDWQLLTKRPENMRRLAAERWEARWPRNAWAGCTVEDQQRANERVPHLLGVPADVRFLSAEPLIGPVSLDLTGIHWLIVGGESGPGARPMDLAWARSLIAQCAAAKVACFFKQAGPRGYEVRPAEGAPSGVAHAMAHLGDDHPQRGWFTDWTLVHADDTSNWYRYLQCSDRKGGDPAEWPADLRVRQMPEVVR